MRLLRSAGIAFTGSALAFLAVSSGLDRMAEAGRSDPSLVPPPIRAGATRAQAAAALQAGDYRRGLSAARGAVAHEPMDATALGLLGEAALLSGDRDGAARAFSVSRQLGWREPLTQIYWIEAGLAHGDFKAAIEPLDALLRQSPGFAGRRIWLTRFEATPQGRRLLIDRLARRPSWLVPYFADINTELAGDPIVRSDVAVGLVRRRGLRDCHLVAPIIEALWRFGHGLQSRAIYRLHCAAPGEPASPADGDFVRARTAQPGTILDWRFTQDGAVGVALESRAEVPGRAVVVSSMAPLTMSFASQPLTLATGRYRVSWRAVDGTGKPSSATDVAISCVSGEHGWADKRLEDPSADRFAADVSIASQCTAQWLYLGIAPGADRVSVGDIRIDRIGTITPVANGAASP